MFTPGSLIAVELSPVKQVVGALHSSHSVRPGQRSRYEELAEIYLVRDLVRDVS